MTFTTCFIVMIGRAFGTLARYIVSVLALPIGRELPVGTILINVTRLFVIGLVGTSTLAHGRCPASENLRLFRHGRIVRPLYHLLVLWPSDARSPTRRRHRASSVQHCRVCCPLHRSRDLRPSHQRAFQRGPSSDRTERNRGGTIGRRVLAEEGPRHDKSIHDMKTHVMGGIRCL
jgi:hypothetical protein